MVRRPVRRNRTSMGRRRIHGQSEQDAFTGWRFVLCYMKRARRSIKPDSNRRERRNMRRSLRQHKEE